MRAPSHRWGADRVEGRLWGVMVAVLAQRPPLPPYTARASPSSRSSSHRDSQSDNSRAELTDRAHTVVAAADESRPASNADPA